MHVTRQGPEPRRIAVIRVEAILPRAFQRTWKRETKVALASCSRAFTSLAPWRRTGHMSTPQFPARQEQVRRRMQLEKDTDDLSDIRFLVPGRSTTWPTSNQCSVRSTNGVGRPSWRKAQPHWLQCLDFVLALCVSWPSAFDKVAYSLVHF